RARDLDRGPGRARDPGGPPLDAPEYVLDFLEREVAQLDHALDLTRDDVRGAGPHLELPHGPDLPARLAHGLLAHRQDQPRGGDQGVAPLRHRRRSGVIAEAGDPRGVAVDPDDPFDHADRHASPVEHSPLLDVKLQVGRNLTRLAARLGDAREVPADAPHGVPDVDAVLGRLQLPRFELADRRAGSEDAAPERESLLVGPDDALERMPGRDLL